MLSQRKRFWAEVDLDAARYNFQQIKKGLNKETKLCCVVKANAYGHGAVYLAKLYEKLGADWFAVSNIEEAIQLRQSGIKLPVLILGYTPAECAALLAENAISQSVFSYEYGEELSKCAVEAGVQVNIHIKLDSGMGRIGFSCKHGKADLQSLEAAKQVCQMPNLNPEGVFTHFAVADEGENGEAYTMAQYTHFTEAVNWLQTEGIAFSIRHCANSAGIADYPELQMDMVRAGVVLYGLKPSSAVLHCPPLKPVLSLKTVVSQVKEIEPGDCVSYGCTYRAEKKKKIATVPVGYADGFWRSNAKVGTCMLLHGKKVPIVGRVCMDQLMLDVSDISAVKPGDLVTVLGTDGGTTVSADDLANANSTINYEIVCAVGERVPRFFMENGEIVAVKDNIIACNKLECAHAMQKKGLWD